MKISLKQLEMSLSKMQYSLLGWSGAKDQDLVVEVTITKEDPGSGVMTDCLTISAVKPSSEEEKGETRMEVEIYPENEKLEPRASKIESFIIKDKY